MVAKRLDSLYYMGKRTHDWIKFKRMADEDFVVVGYLPQGGNMYRIILGKYRKDRLVYKGHVTSGVTKSMLEHLEISERNPFSAIHVGSGDENAVWVVPDHVGATGQ